MQIRINYGCIGSITDTLDSIIHRIKDAVDNGIRHQQLEPRNIFLKLLFDLPMYLQMQNLIQADINRKADQLQEVLAEIQGQYDPLFKVYALDFFEISTNRNEMVAGTRRNNDVVSNVERMHLFKVKFIIPFYMFLKQKLITHCFNRH